MHTRARSYHQAEQQRLRRRRPLLVSRRIGRRRRYHRSTTHGLQLSPLRLEGRTGRQQFLTVLWIENLIEVLEPAPLTVFVCRSSSSAGTMPARPATASLQRASTLSSNTGRPQSAPGGAPGGSSSAPDLAQGRRAVVADSLPPPDELEMWGGRAAVDEEACKASAAAARGRSSSRMRAKRTRRRLRRGVLQCHPATAVLWPTLVLIGTQECLGLTPLRRAASIGHEACPTSSCRRGANKNARNNTAAAHHCGSRRATVSKMSYAA